VSIYSGVTLQMVLGGLLNVLQINGQTLEISGQPLYI
jgi:hypothetical protein